MELRDYFGIIGRRWLMLVLTIIIVTGLFIGYTAAQPVSFKAVVTASFVKGSEAAATNAQYRYDAYYALSSNELLAKLAAGWLAEPNVVSAIYDQAKVALPGADITRYGQLLTTTTLSGASLEIVTKADTSAHAQALASATTKFLTDRTAQLEKSDNYGGISLFTTNPLVEPVTNSYMIIGAVGAIVGLILGLILVFFVEYLKPSGHARG